MIKVEALKLPIQLFLILEGLVFVNLTSCVNYLNFFFVFLKKKYLKLIFFLIKRELFLNSSIIIDIFSFNKPNKGINKKYLYYNLYIYAINIRLSVVTSTTNKLDSGSKVIKGLNWLEREVSEMLSISFKNSIDTRNLLLDYNFKSGVLLKKFNTNLKENVFFNNISETVSYTNCYNVEL